MRLQIRLAMTAALVLLLSPGLASAQVWDSEKVNSPAANSNNNGGTGFTFDVEITSHTLNSNEYVNDFGVVLYDAGGMPVARCTITGPTITQDTSTMGFCVTKGNGSVTFPNGFVPGKYHLTFKAKTPDTVVRKTFRSGDFNVN